MHLICTTGFFLLSIELIAASAFHANSHWRRSVNPRDPHTHLSRRDPNPWSHYRHDHLIRRDDGEEETNDCETQLSENFDGRAYALFLKHDKSMGGLEQSSAFSENHEVLLQIFRAGPFVRKLDSKIPSAQKSIGLTRVFEALLQRWKPAIGKVHGLESKKELSYAVKQSVECSMQLARL